MFSYTKKVTHVEGSTRTILGPRLAVIRLVIDTQTSGMKYIPLIKAFQTFFSEDLFDDISNTIVSRVGIVSLKSCPYDLVRIRSTASKHLADSAE